MNNKQTQEFIENECEFEKNNKEDKENSFETRIFDENNDNEDKEIEEKDIDDEDNTIQLDDVCMSPEESLILKEKVKLVKEIIPTLKKKYRDLLYARMDDLSYKQIEEKLALNECAVKSDLNKARNKLKQKLQKINK